MNVPAPDPVAGSLAALAELRAARQEAEVLDVQVRAVDADLAAAPTSVPEVEALAGRIVAAERERVDTERRTAEANARSADLRRRVDAARADG